MTRVTVGNALLDHLGDVEFQLLAPYLSSKVLDRDTVIHEPGDRMETVYFPSGAILTVITLMEDGRGVESSTIGRESAPRNSLRLRLPCRP